MSNGLKTEQTSATTSGVQFWACFQISFQPQSGTYSILSLAHFKWVSVFTTLAESLALAFGVYGESA